jgi:hypothetical protein
VRNEVSSSNLINDSNDSALLPLILSSRYFNSNRVEDFNTGEHLGFDQGIATYTQAFNAKTGSYKLETDFSFILKEGAFTVTVSLIELKVLVD